MSEQDDQQQDQQQDSQDEGQQQDQTPPWGDDFDPARAWKTIQNLRQKEKDLATERDQFKKANDEIEAAKLSDLEKATKERDEAKALASTSSVELAKLKAAVKHGLSEDDLEFVGGKTPEEIEASAKKLADRLESKSTSGDERPRVRLKGGGDPDEQPEADLRKIADSIPRR